MQMPYKKNTAFKSREESLPIQIESQYVQQSSFEYSSEIRYSTLKKMLQNALWIEKVLWNPKQAVQPRDQVA